MPEEVRVYFAGKVEQHCYRTKIFNNERIMSMGGSKIHIDDTFVSYGGPYALSCDHGCYHDAANGHAMALLNDCGVNVCGSGTYRVEDEGGHYEDVYEGDTPSNDPSLGVDSRRRGFANKTIELIRRADFMFANISTLDAVGTIAEIGMASMLRIPTYVHVEMALARSFEKKDEFWFVKSLPNVHGMPSRYNVILAFMEALIRFNG